ncbi:hypothetical protein PHYSODRAFT_336919 [Phytophthora sojae]|uniref:Uncharacterized protein n=1 Tax=Phytophthora sojae (strain P6497) TaxID=1094619 RepID=G4ZX22_PHYSP|nr:hypothetical protein PHYSODRAFT_336919 [Phytophthora sojae]EGZ12492.1 hypothetical protein PHYSODRAFT_336919 [Phytophthora sojae]|eukprot:XP_009532825.1 hypothetical protein PHYSODRAFT_336919 [Phytophthora sojae]
MDGTPSGALLSTTVLLQDSLDSPTVASLSELLATKTLVAAGDKWRGEVHDGGDCQRLLQRRVRSGVRQHVGS